MCHVHQRRRDIGDKRGCKKLPMQQRYFHRMQSATVFARSPDASLFLVNFNFYMIIKSNIGARLWPFVALHPTMRFFQCGFWFGLTLNNIRGDLFVSCASYDILALDSLWKLLMQSLLSCGARLDHSPFIALVWNGKSRWRRTFC